MSVGASGTYFDNMKHVDVQVKWNAPYPKEYSTRITASSFPTAVARALRAWRSENKGKRITEVRIVARQYATT